MSYEYMAGMGTTATTRRTRVGRGSSAGRQRQTGAAGSQQRTAQAQIPAGAIPIPSSDKQWFKRWLQRVDSKAYNRHQQRDPQWSWAYPDNMARFLDAKSQVTKGLRNVANYSRLPSDQLGGAKNWIQLMLSVWKKCDPKGEAAWITAPQNQTTLRLPASLDRSVAWTMDFRVLRKSQITATFRDPSGKGSSFNTNNSYQNAVRRLPCPDENVQNLIFGRATESNRIKGSDLLANYLQRKNQQLKATVRDQRQRAAAQQQQLRTAYARAQEATANAQQLQQEVTTTQQQLAQSTIELDQTRAQAAQGQAVSGEALAMMEEEVTRLINELVTVNAELAEARREAGLAEDAFEIEQELMVSDGVPVEPLPPIEDLPPLPVIEEDLIEKDLIDPGLVDEGWIDEGYMDPGYDISFAYVDTMDPTHDPGYVDPYAAASVTTGAAITTTEEEPSFFEQYKWHLLAGGVAAVGAWYYVTKVKPAQDAAKIAENFEDYLA